MLHAGFLPQHKWWARVFKGLGRVVLDEAHVYRGVFGSHVPRRSKASEDIAGAVRLGPEVHRDERHDANPEEHAVDLVEHADDGGRGRDSCRMRSEVGRGGSESVRSDHPPRSITRQPPNRKRVRRSGGHRPDGSLSGEDVPDVEPTGEGGYRTKRVKAERRRAVREEPRQAAVAARLRAKSANTKVAAAAAAAEDEGNPGRAVGAAMRAKTKAGAVPEDARDAALVASVRSKAPRSSPIVEVAACWRSASATT